MSDQAILLAQGFLDLSDDPSLAQISAIVAGVIAVIGVVTTSIISIITAIRVGKIETSVNSAQTASVGREAALQAELKLMREALTQKNLDASLLAQAASQKDEGDRLGTRQQEAIDVNVIGQTKPVVVKAEDKK